ncbi:MAG: A/G-specific adenine glycosylase [Planctomycetales bacterium]|nr:A/G-specific adenine glycosylase [Planctomycetales bacterium]
MDEPHAPPAGEPQLKTLWKQRVRTRLLAWYAKHARDLPWRENRDPYRVWVSEVMLQQTQVETVKPYFARFMAEFPTVQALARAPEQRVLKLWEGLGYYRRARGLHAAAKRIVEDHAGRIPAEVATLRKLPGIGRYTAGAIASIAYDRPAPILEANTIRLFTRLVAYRGDATSSRGQADLWRVAEELLPQKRVSQFNQALMELGALVCTPREPACDQCPLEKLCRARTAGLLDELGPTTKKLSFTELREAAVVVHQSNRVLVRRCGATERWAGLWDFPRFELESEGPLFAEQELTRKVAALTGVECQPQGLIKTLKHGVTRYRITLECYRAERTGGRVRSTKDSPVQWVRTEELAELPLSVTGRKIARLIA